MRYDHAREIYREFVQQAGINMSKPNGWGQFIFLAHRSPEGREAFPIASSVSWPWQRPPSSTCWPGCSTHNGDRVLIFTHDNATVYKIARQFLVPVITHQTKTKERREILLRFNAGTFPIVATSRVLNEGVDVPRPMSRSSSRARAPCASTSSPGSYPPQVGRQGGDALRGNHARHRRRVTSSRRRQHDAYDGS